MYRFIRPLLFALPPEAAHTMTLGGLKLVHRLGLISKSVPTESGAPTTLMNLRFPNRVGLAAGLDKNGTCIDALGALGFGFVEVGTITPLPQSGNAKPRLFRLTRDGALINRMGFPNAGAASVVERLRSRRYQGICGVNIGKNATTPLGDAANDYVGCLRAVYGCCDYVAVNISSPNTSTLRDLQHGAQLSRLLSALAIARQRLADSHGQRKPILVKLTADLAQEDLIEAARIVVDSGMDGVIVTNTSVHRDGLRSTNAREEGGLSGLPLLPPALRAVEQIRIAIGPGFPIVGVGGIDCASAAEAMRAAGADLIQIYTGLVYRGPKLVRELTTAL